jgi:hypothetical protein
MSSNGDPTVSVVIAKDATIVVASDDTNDDI